MSKSQEELNQEHYDRYKAEQKSKKKKRGLFGCLGCLGVLILIGVISAAMGGGAMDTDTNDSATKTEETKDTTTENKDKKEEEVKNAKIGEKLSIDDVEFTVNSIENAAVVGSNGLEQNANGKYLVLDVTVKNNKKESLMMSSDFFKIKKGDTNYESDVTASTTKNQEQSPDNLGLLAEELNPGIEKTAKVVFDVPEDVASAKDLQLQVQTGVFGTKTGVIDLK